MSQNSLILVAQSYLRVIVKRYPCAGRGGAEVSPADPAGVGNQIARIGLAKGELLDAALFHVRRGHVAVQNAVGTDKRRVNP